jgi:hypothetical protein
MVTGLSTSGPPGSVIEMAVMVAGMEVMSVNLSGGVVVREPRGRHYGPEQLVPG